MKTKHKLITIVSVLLLMFFVAGLSDEDAHAGTANIFTEHQITAEMFGEYNLYYNDGVIVKKVTSSNSNVVSIEHRWEGGVKLYPLNVGKATITATDSKGNTDTCVVTVKPCPLEFSETNVIMNKYEEGDPYEDEISVWSFYNAPESVTSSNTNVAKASLIEYDKYTENYHIVIVITPVSAGNATITVTDVYGYTATIPVTITQNYIKGIFANSFYDVHYGDTRIYFEFMSDEFIGTDIVATIKGKEYKASLIKNSEGDFAYLIKNIPVLPVGTAINVKISKDNVEYTDTRKIKKGDLYWAAESYLTRETYVYTGGKLTPEVKVEYYYNYYDDEFYAYDIKQLKEGTDYKVIYADNLNVGYGKAKTEGIGNYKGKTEDSWFEIIPKGTTISKLSKGKKAFTVKWKKQAEKMSKSTITGYQIRYSTNSSMSGAKTVTVKGYNKTSKKIKKLKKKKTYYVQIRTYKVVQGDYFYSKWSDKKSVKTK